ncbi:MAG: ribbon-helix-helix domain-containing protein [Rhodospirillaceae bacterium]|jgi:predicted DNA-binding ribbon-helix-helix protein|nr:ribbon-helix-helix domain-containing protein [Rhodospirillaceae bacterium]MBT5038536.1 ribbon-helix-helix domain-containing protein [Rhodospirillaceae bacterium]MBT5676839.1 ribbon-helix-helix domain-containing protein [Rhodospirillaceae bacterium]MBT5779320.1 ribbon-helix-helix domain-containing protein [Rhodospirillaceae bacterium]MBT6828440.1 ribbon-helix-helix domain-containing protein [Rhodospirillaceae bacterium]
MAQSIGKYSVALDGHRTSVSLEPEFWQALKEIAAARRESLSALVSEVDRTREGNLSSALRVFVLRETGK